MSPRLLRFEEVELSQPQPGHISCRVTLAGQEDRVFIGEGSSVILNAGQMNAAARATVHAIQAYTDVQVKLRRLVLIVGGVRLDAGEARPFTVLVSDRASDRRVESKDDVVRQGLGGDGGDRLREEWRQKCRQT